MEDRDAAIAWLHDQGGAARGCGPLRSTAGDRRRPAEIGRGRAPRRASGRRRQTGAGAAALGTRGARAVRWSWRTTSPTHRGLTSAPCGRPQGDGATAAADDRRRPHGRLVEPASVDHVHNFLRTRPSAARAEPRQLTEVADRFRLVTDPRRRVARHRNAIQTMAAVSPLTCLKRRTVRPVAGAARGRAAPSVTPLPAAGARPGTV